ncbi:hypothetical protein ATANTOWER_011007 [Ataeniobius toweri]|uniref:Uncharacterized protein n=1 Tax=Ataeniobius toweri TaxID=208326 RepID=A0ABU7BFP0_9TELE|nr:hypothetical protein [Ataeniobius toweri]
MIIHSLIFYTTSSIQGHGGAGAYLQQSTGERQGTPWTARQPITGQHRHTQDKQPCTHSFTPKGNLERPINLTVMWEEPTVQENTENPRMHGENMQNPCRKTPSKGSNPGPSCCKATVLPTAPPCSPKK